MFITTFIKQFFCNHNYKIERYFQGDMKKYGVGVERCTKCGKGKIIK